MTFDWLDKFHHSQQKAPDYAAKTLAAYRLGMKARGAIAGVRIEIGAGCCAAAQALDLDATHHPDDAPHLPLATCDRAETCPCVYRPVMSYEAGGDWADKPE